MKILAAQINPTIGALSENTQKILAAIEEGKRKNVDLVVVPEMAICGYLPEDFIFHSFFIDAIEKQLQVIVQASRGVMVIVGTIRRSTQEGEKELHNSAAILHDGHLLGYYDKWLLPTYDVFDERRYFEPGTKMRVWPCKGKKIGVIICEDIWQHSGLVEFSNYPQDPILELVPHKPDLLINISASPYQQYKRRTRITLCKNAAKTLSCPVLLCCQVGANEQLIYDGFTLYVDQKGHTIHMGKLFEEDTLLIDTEKEMPPLENPRHPEKTLYHALIVGVRDYFQKQNLKKACLGLSGGIDSAITACIAVEALGKDNVLAVIMPSQFSSKESIEDAEKQAELLGIQTLTIPIEKAYKTLLEELAPHFGGKPLDVTEENIQARIRGLFLMALANKHNYVVLTTGNKSELAMGYCTLYGDMCGGLAVLGDVIKTRVYRLAKWLKEEKGLIPSRILQKPPSAELKPNQTDQDTLPPYEIIDNVIRGYVEGHMPPQKVAKKYKYDLELVMSIIEKIHQMEYKRRQSAPTLRVTKKSFGIGRRYPIVQGWITKKNKPQL